MVLVMVLGLLLDHQMVSFPDLVTRWLLVPQLLLMVNVIRAGVEFGVLAPLGGAGG
jgi:hypothetical protein